jgi:small conductance mechanosensitive channel
MLKYSIITIIIIIIFNYLNHIQPTFVLALLGTLGMAVGLTLQSTVSNFTAGMLIKIFRQFKEGEYVKIEKISGTILNIDIFYTILRTIDGKIAIIPNIKTITGNIINYTRTPIRRNEFFISFSYNVDINKITEIIREILNKEDRVLKNKEILIGLVELSPYSLKFIIRCWSKTKDLQDVYWDLMKQFKIKLDKERTKSLFEKNHLILDNKKII